MQRNKPILDTEFFRGTEAIEFGVLTKKELRSGRYRRLFHGVYASPGVDITHELRCRALALCCPQATITGRSAATLHGLGLARPMDPIEVIVPRDHPVHRMTGVSMRRVRIRARESVPWKDLRLATPLRAAFDLVTTLPIATAVGGVDAMLRARIIHREQLAAQLTGSHDNGVVRGRRAMELLDPRAESPKESELRVLLRLNDLAFEPQVVIELSPNWRVRADLARRAERVIVEYDGAWHGDEIQVAKDRKRRSALRAAGWTVIVCTDADLRADHAELIARVDRALLAARLRAA